uniref:Uncharacterized protein n=1 Tax=Anopheles atroparvus TaxID=41427 RepID=A0A182JMY8_ANOAO
MEMELQWISNRISSPSSTAPFGNGGRLELALNASAGEDFGSLPPRFDSSVELLDPIALTVVDEDAEDMPVQVPPVAVVADEPPPVVDEVVVVVVVVLVAVLLSSSSELFTVSL